MTFFLTLTTALRSLRSNLGRSLLTILGVIIGIVAIVLVVALGQGAQDLILSEIEGIGGNAVIVRPGREPQGPTDAAESILADSLKQREVDALGRPDNVPGALSVEPTVLVPGSVAYREATFRPTMFGWTAEALADFFGIAPEEGAAFTDEDIRQRARVAIIGWRVRDELFGDSDAIGKMIRVKDQNLRVVGVLPQRGQVAFFNVDDLVLLPYTTAQRDLLGINHFHEIFIRTAPGEDVDQVAADVRATLRDLHGITDPDKDDFFVLTQQDIVDRVSTITQVMTIFLVSIAAISLVVGGVGIMNIMLVSVTERTREIGLRKALGATSRDILRQFLLEAVVLTMAGGIIGTLVAVTLSTLVTIIVRQQFSLAWPLTIPLGAILLGVGTASVIGIVFGLYPARHAARKNPIEALRYE